MFVRGAIAVAGILAAGSSLAEPMNADTARRFVAGKLFTYQCFDGTRGAGRIYGDGSVMGTIQIAVKGPVRYATLPPGTLKVKGQAVCASLRGMPFEPCFNLDKTTAHSFRGSVSGLGFAYCDFIQRRSHPVRAAWRSRAPLALQATVDDHAGD